MINVTYSGDKLIAYKVTGDRNIPRGEITFSADVSPDHDKSHSNHKLDPIILSDSSAKKWGTRRLPRFPGHGHAAEPDEQVVISQVWEEIRRFMWNYVGIVRTGRRLMRARKRIDLVQEEINTYYWDFKITGDLVELRNIATVAEVIVECALRRRESRGLHYTLDYPESDSRFLGDTVLRRRF